jgi:hypothetical protein
MELSREVSKRAAIKHKPGQAQDESTARLRDRMY